MPPVRMRERGRAKKGTMTRLVKILFKRYPGKLTVAALCIAFNALANLCSSVFVGLVTGVLASAIKTNTNPFDIHARLEATVMGGSFHITSNVTLLLIMMGIVYAAGVFCSWWWTRTMAIVTQSYMNDFRKAMFNHMQDLPIKYFDTHAHGAIMSLYTNDVDTIRQFISQSLPEFLRTFLSILFSFVMMLINSIWMTLVVLFFSFLSQTIILNKTGISVTDAHGNTVVTDSNGINTTDTNGNNVKMDGSGINLTDINGNNITMSSAGVNINGVLITQAGVMTTPSTITAGDDITSGIGTSLDAHTHGVTTAVSTSSPAPTGSWPTTPPIPAA